MAVEGSGHAMAGFGDFGGLGGECVFVALAIENLDRCLRSGLVSGRGQRALLELSRSLASEEHPAEVTKDQGLPGKSSTRDY